MVLFEVAVVEVMDHLIVFDVGITVCFSLEKGYVIFIVFCFLTKSCRTGGKAILTKVRIIFSEAG